MKKYFIYIFVLVLISCGSSQKVTVKADKFPEWLKAHPNSSLYFVGIGSAKKYGTPDSYMKESRNNALSDMAQSISVNISSTSTSTVFEGNNELYENYQRNVQAKANEIFEGVELVEQFDDGLNYHTFYRISKDEFFRLKAARKQKALDVGLGLYKQAKEQFEQANIARSMSLYVQVINAIMDYLNEDNSVDYEGNKVDLSYAARSEFDKIASSLLLEGKSTSIDARRGDFLGEDKLAFSVLYEGAKVVDVPVSFKYSGGYLKQKYDISNLNGEVFTSINRLRSKNASERISASIDIQSIVRKSSNQLFIRKLFESNVKNSTDLVINIITPSMKFVGDKNYPSYSKRLSESLSNKGIKINGGDDYSLKFSIDKKVKRVSYGVVVKYVVSADVQSAIESTKHKLFYYTFSGDGANKSLANSKALDRLNSAIERRIGAEISRFVLR